MTRRAAIVAAILAGVLGVGVLAQDAPPPVVDPLHKPFDEILDLYVREGRVYYRALKSERARLDRYIRSLGDTALADSWTRERKLAFWMNAYNAFVLQTVIDAYPIRGRSAQYPAGSIRQIPGAFEKRPFRAAGQTVTLDDIEKERIVPLGDARAILALGRGAEGGGRLRSEAYTAERLDSQLEAMAREVVDQAELVRIDRATGELSVNPMFSWREPLFVEAYAAKAAPRFATRSPIERAVLGLIGPSSLQSERDFLDQNSFRVVFHDFNWRLNDLTGR